MAAFAPIPSARETMATTVTKGVLNRVRSANLRLSIIVESIDGSEPPKVYPPSRYGGQARDDRSAFFWDHTMSRATRLANAIERTITGPMWHGPALAQVLEGVTHDGAAARPLPNAHSVWEIVLHVAVWADIARARLKG